MLYRLPGNHACLSSRLKGLPYIYKIIEGRSCGPLVAKLSSCPDLDEPEPKGFVLDHTAVEQAALAVQSNAGSFRSVRLSKATPKFLPIVQELAR